MVSQHTPLHSAQGTLHTTVNRTVHQLYSEHGAQWTLQGTVQGETIESSEMFDDRDEN